MSREVNTNGFAKHVDTVIVLGSVLSAVLWINHQFTGVNSRFAVMEKDIAIIKTILIMKGDMPREFAHTSKTDDPHHLAAEKTAEG